MTKMKEKKNFRTAIIADDSGDNTEHTNHNRSKKTRGDNKNQLDMYALLRFFCRQATFLTNPRLLWSRHFVGDSAHNTAIALLYSTLLTTSLFLNKAIHFLFKSKQKSCNDDSIVYKNCRSF